MVVEVVGTPKESWMKDDVLIQVFLGGGPGCFVVDLLVVDLCGSFAMFPHNQQNDCGDGSEDGNYDENGKKCYLLIFFRRYYRDKGHI